MQRLNSLTEALEALTASVQPVAVEENLSVEQLAGRVLAEPLHAAGDLPGHTQSAMDGYALGAGAGSVPDHYRCVGTSWAGRPFQGRVATGECVRIFTGAVLPAGADAVVLQEESGMDGDRVTFRCTPRPGDNVRRAGEDVRAGTVLMHAGKRVRSEQLGLLVAAGIDRARVRARPRVACFSNGDELRPPGAKLAGGELYDSNRLVLQEDIREFGGEVTGSRCLPDRRDEILAAVAAAAEQADLVLTCGGASVGEADHMRSVVETLGEVRFWKLPIKPGKPVLFGRLRDAWLLGLPGNPVSSWVTSRLILRPLLAMLGGRPLVHPLAQQAELMTDLHKKPGRADYQRGILSPRPGGGLCVQGAGRQDSHRLSVLAAANCLVHLSAESDGARTGERVQVIPFSELRGPA